MNEELGLLIFSLSLSLSHGVFQEHHLQRAISAQQVFREKKESMVIPVPEAESNITYYDRLYKGEFRIPKQLIHIQREWPSALNSR